MRPGTFRQTVLLALAVAAAVAAAGCGSGDSGTASTTTREAAGSGGQTPAEQNYSTPDACPVARYASDMAMIVENRIPGANLIVHTSTVNCAAWSGRGNYTLLRGPIDNRKKLVPMSPVGDAAREFSLSMNPRNTFEQITRLEVRLTHTGYGGAAGQMPLETQTRLRGATEWNPNGSYVVGTLDGRKVRVISGVVKNPGNGSWTAAPKAKGAWLLAFQYAN